MDLENLVNIPFETFPVMVSIFMYSLDDGHIKISFRSKYSEYNVQTLAHELGGGGHIQAAGAKVKMELSECRDIIVKRAQELLF